jgi:hypothetical protein
MEAPGHKYSRFLTINRGLLSCSWRQLFRSIHASKISLPFLFSQLIFFISFPSSIPTLIPLFFFPFSFPFVVTMLGHISKTNKQKSTGLQVGGLVGLHLHPCSYVMSLTDHLVIIYLTIFATTSSRVQSFISQVLQSPICTQRLMIYIMTVRLVMSTDPLSISFLLFPSLTDRFATLRLFFIIHNHRFMGSWVGGFTKGSIFKFLLFIPAIFMIFPICI